LTSVASKLLDLDSDTMNMLSTPHESQTIKNSTNHLSVFSFLFHEGKTK
jgi:hypothetical protein